MTEEITMDYMDIVCNGKSSNSTSKINTSKRGLFSDKPINHFMSPTEPINN